MGNDTTALAEARALYRMLATGHTTEELRECIGVPSKIDRKLRLYAAMNPAEACWIEKILKFRKFVAKELDLLVCAGDPVSELPETTEAASDIAEGAIADASDQGTELRNACKARLLCEGSLRPLWNRDPLREPVHDSRRGRRVVLAGMPRRCEGSRARNLPALQGEAARGQAPRDRAL